MVAKLLVAIAVSMFSLSCAAQAVPEANYPPRLSIAVGGGMDYMSGDWQAGKINRWGPTAWASTTILDS